MATNDFIGFASNGSANVMSQADYAAASEQGVGVPPGMASSALANKIWRQGANMAAALDFDPAHNFDTDAADIQARLLAAERERTRLKGDYERLILDIAESL